MEIMTRDFGEIEINEDDIIEFPEAIPGFPAEDQFVLFPLGEDSPFIVMQSVNSAELAFITIEPGNYLDGYEFEISDELAKKLKI
ncbi:MAG: flagellar assembly protein FliW, partial [Halanaerobiales bacterium]